MDYTIKIAKGLKFIIDLSKSGNKYNVALWNKDAHKVDLINDFEVYREAENYFFALCNAYGIDDLFIEDVKHDLSDFANID